MGVFDIKSNGLVIANNGETKLINKHCFNNKKARFVNVEIPPTKLTYRISQITGNSVLNRGIFIQARPIESTDDDDFVGLLGVITEFWNLGESAEYPNAYLYYYADTDKRKYLSEYGVVGKDLENETFYTNGEIIETVDISSFPENPSDAVLYRIIEDGEKHYYRYYSDSNLFVRVYFSTDIIDLTYKPSRWSRDADLYEHLFYVFHHNTKTKTNCTSSAEYIPSILVSNNIANKINFSSNMSTNFYVSPIKMTDKYSHISTETNLFSILAFRGLSSDNKYYVSANAYYRNSNNELRETIPCKIYRDTTSGAQDYGGSLMLYYQEMHDYFAEIFPEITDDMTLNEIDEYINTDHTSPYSFIWFEPFTESPIDEDITIKKDINHWQVIYPIIIKDVPNDQLSEIYFCQSDESSSKAGYPDLYIGQPMLNKRMRFNVPYSVAFLNSKVPGHFPYTTYNIWSGKRYINIALPQTEYDITPDTDPIISARRLANSTKEPYTSFIAKVFPGSYIIYPDTKTVKTSGIIHTIRLYNFTVYETHTNVTLKPYYQNGEILYWYYIMYGQYDPDETLGDEGSIELRLYNNLDSLDNPNTLCMICDFDEYTYFDLIGIELFNFNLKQELEDAEGNGVITATSTVTNPIYDVMLEQDDELELPYHYSYSSSTKKLHVDLNSNVIKYPIGTYGRLTVNESYIGPYVIARSKNINFNFTEDSTLNNIINENPNVVDYDGPHVLTVDTLPRSFERITDYYDVSIGSFRYYRERYRTTTETIEFSRTMDFDTSKSLYLTFKQFNIYTVDGNKKESSDLHYRLEYNSYYGGWYDSFYDDIVDEEEEYTLGYIGLLITNTGITITLNDYATYNNDESAWSIEILNGLSLYQEED